MPVKHIKKALPVNRQRFSFFGEAISGLFSRDSR